MDQTKEETKEGEVKEGEVKEGEVKEEKKEGEAKEGEAKEGEAKEGEAKEGEAKEGEAKEGEAKEGETKEGEAKEGEAKEGEAKEGEAKEGEAKEGEAKEGESETKEGEKEESTSSVKILGGFFVFRSVPDKSEPVSGIVDSGSATSKEFDQSGEIVGIVLIKQYGIRKFMGYSPIEQFKLDAFITNFSSTSLNNAYDNNQTNVFEIDTMEQLINRLIVQSVE